MIYIVLLAYNEEQSISPAIQEIAKVLRGEDIQIVVVNDGSTDQTKEKVEALAKTCHTVVVSHLKNLGVGQALRTGLSYVNERGQDENVVVVMEADGTSDSLVLPEMIRKIRGGVDVVCASRYCNGGGYKGFPWFRLVCSRGANALLAFFFPVKGIRDYTIFYRGYRLSAIRKAYEHYGDRLVTCRGFAANGEILLKLRPLGLRFAEVPLRYNYGQKKSPSKIRILKTISEYLRLSWKGSVCREF